MLLCLFFVVAEFAKKTGDFPSLSATDIKVMALTYQLEKEHVGVEHLKSIPEINRSVNYCNYSAITAQNIAGFYQPKKVKLSLLLFIFNVQRHIKNINVVYLKFCSISFAILSQS